MDPEDRLILIERYLQHRTRHPEGALERMSRLVHKVGELARKVRGNPILTQCIVGVPEKSDYIDYIMNGKRHRVKFADDEPNEGVDNEKEST